MFKPKTKKIQDIYKKKKSQPDFLNKKVFKGPTNIYIDWANVYNWQDKLKWHIDTKRLYDFLISFNQVKKIKIYQGFFEDNEESKDRIEDYKNCGYEVRTKPAKKIKINIDVNSIAIDSTVVLKRVVSKTLISKLSVEAVEQMNKILREINEKGDYILIQHKCNFDVEMASDIKTDFENKDNENIETFVIVSGDSDFVDTVESLISSGKRVVILGTGGRVSRELSYSKAYIYDIKQIKNFICWNRERDV